MAKDEINEVPDAAARRSWKQDPEAVRENILQTARAVFVAHGLSGAKMDEIAARTRTSKRMIYYYFGDKEGLYRAVLEDAYARMRRAEDDLDLGRLHPVEALRQLTEFTFDHHNRERDFVRLVMVENIHEGRHMSKSEMISGQNSSAIRLLEEIYKRGCDEGLFRSGLTALELHWHISALAIFNVSNRATFSNIFGSALFEPKGQDMLRRHTGDMVLRFVMKPGLSPEDAEQRPQTRPRKIDPGIYRFLEVLEAQKASLPEGTTLEARRVLYNSIARNLRLPTPPNIETDSEHWIDSPGRPVRVRLFRHQSSGPQPALVYLHGGGFSQGSPESHWDITARLASWTRQTVISVDYALAPQHPCPAALEQTLSVLGWTRDRASDLGIDATRIAVGGDGAGGNLAAATAMICRDKNVPLCAQLLIYPICDFDLSRPSCLQNGEGPLLRVDEINAMASAYCPDTERQRSDPLVAPLLAPSHRHLPPAFIALAANDPMRDSGAAYAAALKTAGVEVTVDEGDGLVHDYLRAQSQCALAEDKLRIMSDWLYEVFRMADSA